MRTSAGAAETGWLDFRSVRPWWLVADTARQNENILDLFSDLDADDLHSDKVRAIRAPVRVCRSPHPVSACVVVLQELLFSFLKVRYELSHDRGARSHTAHAARSQHMPGTAREVSRFLKVFSATENHRFAVIKIGGAVVEENLDELVKQLAFLHRVGL